MTEQNTNQPEKSMQKRLIINGCFQFHARKFSGRTITNIDRLEVLIEYTKISDTSVAVYNMDKQLLGYATCNTVGGHHG